MPEVRNATRWLDPEQERAWRGYRQMTRLLGAQLARDLAADSGLSEPDYDVLSTLTEAEGDRSRARELAARLEWSTSRLSHHVGRMQRRGLVRREDCAHDARGAFVVLTDAGRSAIERAAPDHVAAVRRHFVDVLSPARLRALTEVAEAVVRHLEDGGFRSG